MNCSSPIDKGYSSKEPKTHREWLGALPEDIDPSWEPDDADDIYPVPAIPRLYHYTTFPGLKGIVKSGTLWGSDLRTLNDETEYEHGLGIIRQAMQAKLAGSAPGFEKEAVEVILRTFEAMIPRLRFYITSLSEVGDVLSQWRGYGHEGGVSIGFKYDELKLKAGQQECRLVKCIYSDQAKKVLINEKVDSMVEYMKSFRDQGQRWEPTVLVPLFEVSTMATAFKHRAFREEREWRIISRTEPRTVESGGQRRFEFALAGGSDSKSPKSLGFDHVIIGPTARRDTSFQDSVRSLLDQHVDDCKTTLSKVPYRTV